MNEKYFLIQIDKDYKDKNLKKTQIIELKKLDKRIQTNGDFMIC